MKHETLTSNYSNATGSPKVISQRYITVLAEFHNQVYLTYSMRLEGANSTLR